MGDNTPKHESLSPEQQAFINVSISAAVREAISAMGPILQSVAMTPEKMLEMERLRRAPSEDEVKAKQREARERALMKEDIEEARRNTERMQKQCPGPHKDKNGRYSISLIHNYPDRQARGVCTHCHLMIEPTHWEIGPPDEKNPRGKAHLVKAHELYHIVAEIENTPS
jgi:hypothetical protein